MVGFHFRFAREKKKAAVKSFYFSQSFPNISRKKRYTPQKERKAIFAPFFSHDLKSGKATR
jgi:hypothetical protein